MTRLCTIVTAFIALLHANFSAAQAEDVVWKTVSAGFDIADDQRWTVTHLPSGAKITSFRFSAVRFHLGYFEVKLVDVGELAVQESARIARDQKLDPKFHGLFELGLRTVYKTNTFGSRIMAVAPAGFTTSSRDSSNRGLLKINGVVKSKLLEKGPTAIICLDNAPSPEFQYQVPTFFRTDSRPQRQRVERCGDEVQVGPRIIEDPSAIERSSFELDPDKYGVKSYRRKINQKIEEVPVFLGIPEKAATRTPFTRTVFAVDEPGRIGAIRTQRDLARNAYIVVTTTPATLWDIQDMLSAPQFYANERYAPRWAVNLPGDDYSGLIYVKSLKDEAPVEIGDVQLRQASAFVVIPRKLPNPPASLPGVQ